MKKIAALQCAFVSIALLSAPAFGRELFAHQASAAPIEKESSINGLTGNYAVIDPIFTATQASGGPQSFIRLFNGSPQSGTSTFNVTVVGSPSGHTYGTVAAIKIPHYATLQYSIQEILGLAGAGALTGGDTDYALYVQNGDAEAGFQHVVYDWTSALFENMGSCGSLLNEQLVPLHKEMFLTSVQTSKLSYPSSIKIHNYSAAPITYNLTIFNAGSRLSSGAASTTSGKQTCQITGNTIAANASLLVPFSTIEAHAGCTLDSDESYANILISNALGSAAPNAVVTHLVKVTQYNGNSNLTDLCAVNPVSTSGGAPQYFITNSTSGQSFSLAAHSGIEAFTISNLSQNASGVPIATGTLQSAPTGTLLRTATGFNFTLPDGKIVNYNIASGSTQINGAGDYENKTVDNTQDIEIHLTNDAASPLAFSTYGFYVESDPSGDPPIALGTLATGIAATVPTSGTVTYTGNIAGIVASATNTGAITGAAVTLIVNYTAKTFTGTVTGVATQAPDQGAVGTMSSLSLTGTLSGNSFTGTVAATATAGATFNLGSLTGSVSGKIYGGTGAEAAANLTMSGGGTTVIAAFGAKQ